MKEIKSQKDYKPANYKSINIVSSIKGGSGKTALAMSIAAAHRMNIIAKLRWDIILSGGVLTPEIEADLTVKAAALAENVAYVECDTNLSDFYNAFAKKDENGIILPESQQPKNLRKIKLSSASQQAEFVEIASADKYNFNTIIYNIKADDTDSFKKLVEPCSELIEMFLGEGYECVNIWSPITTDLETLTSIDMHYKMFGDSANYIAAYNRHFLPTNPDEYDQFGTEAIFKGDYEYPGFKTPYHKMKKAGVLKEVDLSDITHEVYKNIRMSKMNFSEVNKKNSGILANSRVNSLVNKFTDSIIDII
ncbi:MAG TPA: hypothetical protein VM577_03685 [Anaerovoracaceae bacterium]|nr:hypothetical protein [Anaerovoracaceae bacterium]